MLCCVLLNVRCFAVCYWSELPCALPAWWLACLFQSCMYTCMYVCMHYVCTYTCTSTHVHLLGELALCSFIHATLYCLSACIHMHPYIHVQMQYVLLMGRYRTLLVCRKLWSSVCIYMYVCVCVYIYIYRHLNWHICICDCVHVGTSKCQTPQATSISPPLAALDINVCVFVYIC